MRFGAKFMRTGVESLEPSPASCAGEGGVRVHSRRASIVLPRAAVGNENQTEFRAGLVSARFCEQGVQLAVDLFNRLQHPIKSTVDGRLVQVTVAGGIRAQGLELLGVVLNFFHKLGSFSLELAPSGTFRNSRAFNKAAVKICPKCSGVSTGSGTRRQRRS